MGAGGSTIRGSFEITSGGRRGGRGGGEWVELITALAKLANGLIRVSESVMAERARTNEMARLRRVELRRNRRMARELAAARQREALERERVVRELPPPT